MTDAGQHLPFRLRRKPSPSMVVLQRLAFTSVWNGFFALFIFLTWPHRATTPIAIQALLRVFVLIGLGMVWDVVVRLFRTLAGKTALGDVDRQPLRRGE